MSSPSPSPKPSPLGPEQAALIARRVSIIVGSCGHGHQPHVMRAVGCRVSSDRRRITLLMPRQGGDPVLEDLRDNGLVAVVFSEPSTHQTVQVKGIDAEVAPCGPGDAALADEYLRRFSDEIGQLGFPSSVAQTMLSHGDDLVAVHFSVAAAFEQTPGPAAGEALTR